MAKKVSVIMAAYNAEPTIRESIDSILQQTFQDWELIICDDGSTDETWEILDQRYQFYDFFAGCGLIGQRQSHLIDILSNR